MKIIYTHVTYLSCQVCFPTVECLEELGLLIQNNGMVVCQPTPQKAVQVIAQQISDRDTNVRNAALNTLVVVYDNIGETVYKYAGQVCMYIMYGKYKYSSILSNKTVTTLSRNNCYSCVLTYFSI